MAVCDQRSVQAPAELAQRDLPKSVGNRNFVQTEKTSQNQNIDETSGTSFAVFLCGDDVAQHLGVVAWAGARDSETGRANSATVLATVR